MAASMVAMAQAGLTKDNPLVLEVGKTYKFALNQNGLQYRLKI